MLDLLPESVWNSKTRFLDICCKSGNFLIEIYNRLDRILSSDNNFKDPVKRRKHILENQIYGICTDSFEEMMIKRRLLGDPFSDNENISTIAYVHPVSGASKQFRELVQLKKYKTQKEREQAFGQIQHALKEKFKQMDFDVVVGNPPYNNDMYLDFVMIGHKLAKQFTLMITPAKWQAKGGGQNDLFRKTIVPYMSKIVYYPNSQDVFDIDCQGGVCYYLICSEIHSETDIKIKGKLAKDAIVSNNCIMMHYKNCVYMLKIEIANLVLKVLNNSNFRQLTIKNISAIEGGINVKFTNVFSDVKKMSKNPSYVIISPYIDRSKIDINSHTSCIRVCKSVDEANSFISYLNSRLVRFLVMLNAFTVAAVNPETWRFVPDPGSFDHIFTDEELYKKYSLTDDEIKLIESVIKERK